jgi:hypothetical protein
MEQSEFNENFVVQDTFARMGTMSWTYYNIAEQAYESFLIEEMNRLPSPKAGNEQHDPTDWMEQSTRLQISGVKTIVFIAMCIEAAAFDFSAIQLGDSYTKLYLDKLDLVSKWVVVPKLVSGKSLKKTSPALNSLKALVKSRNSLVHHKSLPFEINSRKNYDNLTKASEAFPNDVHNAFKAVVLLSLELTDLLQTSATGLPHFEKYWKSFEEPPMHVKKMIEQCRIIHSRTTAVI